MNLVLFHYNFGLGYHEETAVCQLFVMKKVGGYTQEPPFYSRSISLAFRNIEDDEEAGYYIQLPQ